MVFYSFLLSTKLKKNHSKLAKRRNKNCPITINSALLYKVITFQGNVGSFSWKELSCMIWNLNQKSMCTSVSREQALVATQASPAHLLLQRWDICLKVNISPQYLHTFPYEGYLCLLTEATQSASRLQNLKVTFHICFCNRLYI